MGAETLPSAIFFETPDSSGGLSFSRNAGTDAHSSPQIILRALGQVGEFAKAGLGPDTLEPVQSSPSKNPLQCFRMTALESRNRPCDVF